MREITDFGQGSVGSGQPPWPKEIIEPVVAPQLGRFAQVLTQAWDGFAQARDGLESRMGEAGRASRGMVVSDLTRVPAAEVFASVAGVRVVERFQRPWVHLDGGRVQVRFRMLTPTLGIVPGQSERAVRLAYHLPDLTLDLECPEATVLTAGYVLNAAETQIVRMALVCHVGFSQIHYWFDLPGDAAVAGVPTQLPLAPLSPPVIRSARSAVQKRLAERGGQ